MKSRKWGMPTLVEFDSLEANAKLCRRLGLDFVEINMNLPMFQHDALDAAAEISDRYGIGFTIHLDENFVPADFNPLIAQAHMETLRQTICAAKRIGAPVINMHMSRGVYFKLPGEKVFLFERYREQYLDRMHELRSLCEDEIGADNLRVCIENTDGYMGFQKEAIDILLKSDAFALTWDVGHSHGAEPDDAAFILKRQDRLMHFHIHDAVGKTNHLALGEGELPVEERLLLADALKARCVVEIKTADALGKSVNWLRQYGWM